MTLIENLILAHRLSSLKTKYNFGKPTTVYTYYKSGKLVYAGLMNAELAKELENTIKHHWSNTYTHGFTENYGTRRLAENRVSQLRKRIKR